MHLYLRIMRTTNAIDPLLSRSVQEILTALLLEGEKPWYFRDLAKRVSRTPSTLQRPLDSLIQAGIIKKWTEGNRVYFAAEPECPFLAELRGLVEKTVGLVDVLRDVLRTHQKSIQVAFVHGSVARGKERSESDVDLIVIGRRTLSDLVPALSKAEARLRRPVNATVYSPSEFAEKLARKNHFLRSVLAKEKIFVAGTAHDLEELAKSRPRRAARHEPSRAR
ncbi:MAG: nucleotidyltransferase domain-containing protein [Planctomycetia bacterium]|nr:nucleotidyltransferase domain-containing protein [Planctomycetia bacterium]